MSMPAEDPTEGAITAGVRSLLGTGWRVRPNPIIYRMRAVQLSLIYLGHDRVKYVDVITLSFNAPSLVLHCLATYDPDHPYEHNVIWEECVSVTKALEYARELNRYLSRPAESRPAEHTEVQQPGDAPP